MSNEINTIIDKLHARREALLLTAQNRRFQRLLKVERAIYALMQYEALRIDEESVRVIIADIRKMFRIE